MTYSIVARDPETGELGVAVQSHWFAVGRLVTWAESGVGAVATQSMVEPAYGPLGIELMRGGKSAPDSLRALLTADADADVRQVAMVDATGAVAAHTGERCIAEAGHVAGEGFSVQANIMAKPTVWGAMATAYSTSSGDLVTRLLASLDAAEAEGGDLRGRQSAAILVVAATPTGRHWDDRLLELRVEDHPAPLEELRRLVQLWRAYGHAERAEEAEIAGGTSDVLAEYETALSLAPGDPELSFWTAISLARAGRIDDARATMADPYRVSDDWRELLRRLHASGHTELDDAAVRSLLEA